MVPTPGSHNAYALLEAQATYMKVSKGFRPIRGPSSSPGRFAGDRPNTR